METNKCLPSRDLAKEVLLLFTIDFINNPHPSLTNNSCFDLQQYVETKLKTKYNLTSTTIYFEVINLNESFTIDLDEQDIKNVR